MKRAALLVLLLVACRDKQSMSGVYTGTATVELVGPNGAKSVREAPDQIVEVEATWHYNAGMGVVKVGKDCRLEGNGDIVSLALSTRGGDCVIDVPGGERVSFSKEGWGSIRREPESEYERPRAIRLELRHGGSVSYVLRATPKPR